ncbi:LLM class flavin-dependent oxidoreductase [Nocardiopsis sp. ARC36]
MTVPERPLSKLGFLTIGLFDEDEPAAGHENTLRMIELGESLGFDSAWLRDRHLQHGISSPVAVLAAATQRTSRIELGTAVIPLGLENPFRLAEDLATVDVLSGGRLNPGSAWGLPPTTTTSSSTSTRTAGTRRTSAARACPGSCTTCAANRSARSPAGRASRRTRGASSRTRRAGRPRLVRGGRTGLRRVGGEQGLNLLTSSVVRAEEDDDFARVQRSHILRFRERHPLGERARVSQGLVVIPTDSATPAQRRKYEEYARGRLARTTAPQGPGRLLFAPDLVGSSERIAQALAEHAGFQQVDEVVFALPFTFEYEDYEQILTDTATRLGPLLGWTPAGRGGQGA